MTKKVLLAITLIQLCLPLQAQLNDDVDKDTTKWFNRTQRIDEVTVRAKREKYNRKAYAKVALDLGKPIEDVAADLKVTVRTIKKYIRDITV